MLPYFLVFVIAILYYILDNKKNSILLQGLFFLYLAIFVGLGDMIGGYDRYIYGEVFDTIADEMRRKGKIDDLLYLINGHEYGYFAWQILVSYITENRYIFIFITTLVCYLLYFLSFKKYIEQYPIASIIFLGLFYYFTMTYLRQVFAVGILWNSIQYIWQRKPIKFFALVLLAFTFHSSAFIFIPMYFLPIRKFNRKSIAIFLFLCMLLAFTPIPNTFMLLIGEASGIAERTQQYSTEKQGFRIEYILEVMFFLTILFLNYAKIKNNPKNLIFLNMSFVFCGILLFFMQFGQGGRLGWYYILGIIYTLSNLCYGKNVLVWMRPLIITVNFLLFVRMTTAWTFNLSPYKTFLTNGEPSGEPYIYRTYEYDINYTENKFYK
ncbi:MAG: EpsG family protein [Prevotella sp.]|nr:EpsG family protein [Prevotellaceae bacterium]MDY3935559.1 EpsG family protein [Prevotella sp.]